MPATSKTHSVTLKKHTPSYNICDALMPHIFLPYGHFNTSPEILKAPFDEHDLSRSIKAYHQATILDIESPMILQQTHPTKTKDPDPTYDGHMIHSIVKDYKRLTPERDYQLPALEGITNFFINKPANTQNDTRVSSRFSNLLTDMPWTANGSNGTSESSSLHKPGHYSPKSLNAIIPALQTSYDYIKANYPEIMRYLTLDFDDKGYRLKISFSAAAALSKRQALWSNQNHPDYIRNLLTLSSGSEAGSLGYGILDLISASNFYPQDLLHHLIKETLIDTDRRVDDRLTYFYELTGKYGHPFDATEQDQQALKDYGSGTIDDILREHVTTSKDDNEGRKTYQDQMGTYFLSRLKQALILPLFHTIRMAFAEYAGFHLAFKLLDNKQAQHDIADRFEALVSSILRHTSGDKHRIPINSMLHGAWTQTIGHTVSRDLAIRLAPDSDPAVTVQMLRSGASTDINMIRSNLKRTQISSDTIDRWGERTASRHILFTSSIREIGLSSDKSESGMSILRKAIDAYYPKTFLSNMYKLLFEFSPHDSRIGNTDIFPELTKLADKFYYTSIKHIQTTDLPIIPPVTNFIMLPISKAINHNNSSFTCQDHLLTSTNDALRMATSITSREAKLALLDDPSRVGIISKDDTYTPTSAKFDDSYLGFHDTPGIREAIEHLNDEKKNPKVAARRRRRRYSYSSSSCDLLAIIMGLRAPGLKQLPLAFALNLPNTPDPRAIANQEDLDSDQFPVLLRHIRHATDFISRTDLEVIAQYHININRLKGRNHLDYLWKQCHGKFQGFHPDDHKNLPLTTYDSSGYPSSGHVGYDTKKSEMVTKIYAAIVNGHDVGRYFGQVSPIYRYDLIMQILHTFRSLIDVERYKEKSIYLSDACDELMHIMVKAATALKGSGDKLRSDIKDAMTEFRLETI